ncbi:MOSC domain-containing protein, partial [Alicyclobacillus sp.]|uniref:MOSC domain-containing protein n=1 Tax=Alicyclobacillus sp. TaxID=61169 RepID=UPI003459FD65|nr:hypothetical protein [Alicyclobacillus sp.]
SRVESTGRSGWYTRVLKTGWVAPGDTVERLDCPCPEWTIRRAQSVRLGLEMLRRPSRAGAAADGDSPERPLFSRSGEGGVEGVAAAQDARALLDDAEALAACPHLSPDWRHLMRTALQGLRG